jgi:hypothetical protein
MLRRLENFANKYGPEAGPVLYHVLLSQAAHAGVSARLRRKLDVLEGRAPAPEKRVAIDVEPLPLFPEAETEPATAELVAACA